MARLTELIERVKKMDGPSREVDCAVAVAVDGFEEERREWRDEPDYVRVTGNHREYPGHGGDQLIPHYTISLDAAIALCARVLPGWAWFVEQVEDIPTREWSCVADIWLPAQRTQKLKVERVRAGANTPAIALCLAILRALSHKEGGS